jgi:hypothetical protein
MYADHAELDLRYARPRGDINNYYPLSSDQQLLYWQPVSSFHDKEREERYTEILDLQYEVDLVVMDDSYIQIEDVTIRDRTMLTLKQSRKYEWPKESIIDPDVKNNPRLAFLFSIERVG